MNRRGFLKTLGLTAVGAAVLPEILEPSSRTIFLPPRGGWWMGIDPGSGDFTTVALRFKTTERFSLNTADWRGIYGSGDGVALQSVAHPENRRRFLIPDEDNSLSEKSLERLMIEIRDSVGKPIRLKPKYIQFTDPNAWYIKT